jgi:hypothetical protein
MVTKTRRQRVGPTAMVAVRDPGVPRQPSITITTGEMGRSRRRNPNAIHDEGRGQTLGEWLS